MTLNLNAQNSQNYFRHSEVLTSYDCGGDATVYLQSQSKVISNFTIVHSMGLPIECEHIWVWSYDDFETKNYSETYGGFQPPIEIDVPLYGKVDIYKASRIRVGNIIVEQWERSDTLTINYTDACHPCVNIYPNPVIDELNIETNEPVRIQLFYQTGWRIFDRVIDSYYTFDFSTYPNGFYNLRIIYRGRVENKLILK